MKNKHFFFLFLLIIAFYNNTKAQAGNWYHTKDDVETAWEYYEKAIEIRRETLGEKQSLKNISVATAMHQ